MSEKKIEEMRYEEAFGELENIVALLEDEQRTLDESMQLFERGQKLQARCAVLLDEATLKIKQLVGDDLVEEDDE